MKASTTTASSLPLIVMCDNDDASTSSTFAAASPNMMKKPQHLQLIDRQDSLSTVSSSNMESLDNSTTTTSTSSKRKFLQFAAETTEFSASHDNEDSGASWYSAQEYTEFKQDTKRVCKKIILSDIQDAEQRARRSLVQVTFESFNVEDADEEDLDTLPTATADESQLFQQWIAADSSRHGLEIGSNRFLASDKAQRRTALLDTVLQIQHAAREHDLPADVLAQVIADATARQSRPSRTLALRLGQAQWANNNN